MVVPDRHLEYLPDLPPDLPRAYLVIMALPRANPCMLTTPSHTLTRLESLHQILSIWDDFKNKSCIDIWLNSTKNHVHLLTNFKGEGLKNQIFAPAARDFVQNRSNF